MERGHHQLYVFGGAGVTCIRDYKKFWKKPCGAPQFGSNRVWGSTDEVVTLYTAEQLLYKLRDLFLPSCFDRLNKVDCETHGAMRQHGQSHYSCLSLSLCECEQVHKRVGSFQSSSMHANIKRVLLFSAAHGSLVPLRGVLQGAGRAL